jgi:hypothetical protein
MNSQSLITYKLKYNSSDEANAFILKCMKQYSSLLHYGYNRVVDGWSAKHIKDAMKTRLNNVELMDSHIVSCAQQQATGIHEQKTKTNTGYKIIFGGKKNYIRRCKGLISKEEYQYNRISPLLSMGEANQKGNRKFKINQDLHTITFQINRYNHHILELKSVYGKREKVLSKLYELQEKKEIPITYKLDREYIYISFDESLIENYKRNRFVENRVMSIDMNPNYIGWSIVDWNGEGENDFRIVKTGIFSIEKINKISEELIKNNTDSEDPKKIYLNNKRTYETYQISKKLIDICLYYQCESFCIEDLNINSKDAERGKKYNRLVNNNWCRNKLELNLQKRCNIFDIKYIKVKPDFSSFVGNFLFRSLNLPDMVLASIEIGRRGYEFNLQYIEKIKEIKRNIIFPDLGAYKNFYVKSLEEFDIEDGIGLKDIYYALKKSKTRYRLSLEQTGTEFSRCFSKTSLILKCYNNF